MATTTKPLYGSNNQAITITLASLAAGAGRGSTAIDNTSALLLDALVTVKIKTGASGNGATGTIEVYAYATTDGGTTYTDGFAGSDAGATPSAAIFLGAFPAVANATTYVGGPLSVAAGFGGSLPNKWGIIIKNNTGGALDATGGNFAVQYQGVQLQNA